MVAAPLTNHDSQPFYFLFTSLGFLHRPDVGGHLRVKSAYM